MTLSEYVLKRNGIPLGAQGSLLKNLRNSFGAESSVLFWKYWNPIWGFYLSKYIYLPLNKYLPKSISSIITFGASGALHDLAIGLLGLGWQNFLTIWFVMMGAFMNISKSLDIRYGSFGFSSRAVINISSIASCFFLAKLII
ncbi:MBOAT family protein [Gammaproteobacteria bacterium]|nr:MBOAT family protein [Gammaproteobacteria bacterium]MDC1358384.1 MBOAT family protein [Gammaproteobacteria bacterium]